MGLLDQPGDLSATPLAALLLELLNLRADGVLEVGHGGGTSRLWFRAGQPVGAQVATGLRPLGLVLLQSGKIDVDALSRSLVDLAATRRPQGELLVEMGAVSRQDVEAALSEQQAGYLAAIATLDGGRFSFDAAQAVPEWTRGIRISPLRTIIDALERPQAGGLVTSALRPVALGGVRLASGYAQVAPAFGWQGSERALVDRLQHPVSLEFFFDAGEGVAPERARAILAGLLLLGLAVPSAESPQATGETLAGVTLGGLVEAEGGEASGPRPVPPPTPAPVAPAPARTPAPTASPARPGPATGTPGTPGTQGTPATPAIPGMRSDPVKARARRQRLLAKAMENMGAGPFNRSEEAQASRPAPASRDLEPGAAALDPAVVALRAALLEIAPRAREVSFFARLGLPETARREDVKAAFLALARQFHPDLFAGPAMADLQETVRGFFAAVNEAYQALSDDKRRAQHLAALRTGGAAGPERAEAARIDFQKGEACMRTRDFARARGFLESAARTDPRPEYQAALAMSYLVDAAGRDLARARTLVDLALARPGSDRVHYVAGMVAREEGKEGEAERQFRAAVAANPRNAEAVRELRALEARRGQGRR